MCLVINMKSFQTVHCATAIIFIIIQLTECYSRNAENHVQFILSESKNVQFVNKLRQPDVTVKPYNDVIDLWNLDNPLDILAEKDGSSQEESPNSKYFKTEGDNNSRIPRQINNGYSSIYPSLPTYTPNAYNMYSTPYKTPGPQYNGFSSPPTNPYNMYSTPYKTPGPQYNGFASPPTNNYNYPSNVYPSNYNRYPQNSTFKASVPSFNYSSRPSYYPQGHNIHSNSSTNPTYIPNNGYNQPSGQNSNRYNHYNNSHNYSLHSNITNVNSGYPQPNYNPFFGLAGRTNNSNIYNTPNAYNFNTRNNPVYDSSQSLNGSFYSQPFRSSNFSTPSYPTYRPSAVNANFRSNNSSNYPQNPAFNPYFTPNTPISNQTYSVNNSSYYNHRNPQDYNQNNYYNNPQNNSYYNSNKNRFNTSFSGTTLNRPYQNNLLYNATTFPNNVYNYNTHLNQYTQTTTWSTPYSRPNTRSPNNFGGPNQSNWTEPNHFFYTPGGNNFNGTINNNFRHKYYK